MERRIRSVENEWLEEQERLDRMVGRLAKERGLKARAAAQDHPQLNRSAAIEQRNRSSLLAAHLKKRRVDASSDKLPRDETDG